MQTPMELFFLFLTSHLFIGFTYGSSLPSIWGQEGKAGKSKSYHIKSEIQLPESGRSFFSEEWADFDRRLLRLDLIDSTSGMKNTILGQHDTGEIFHYRPFVCSLIEQPSHVMDEELSHKFPITDSFMLTGIGSLWSSATNVTLRKVRIVPGEKSRKGPSDSERQFSKYTAEKTAEYPYKINFYFRDSDTETGPENLAVIDLESENSRISNFKVRFRVMSVELSPKMDADRDVFKLPEGYGCKRKSQLDQIMSSPIIETLTVSPQALRFNIISMSPGYDKRDLDRWHTHSSLVRLLVGRIYLNDQDNADYLMMETEEYVSRPNGESGLRKSKQTWSLEKNGLTTTDKNSSHSPHFWSFNIDERTGSCSVVEDHSFVASSGIDLPINGQEGATSDRSYLGLSLNIETIHELLVSKDLHLIKVEPSAISTTLKDVVWEKRISTFKMKDQSSRVFWSGPISIVRRQSYDWVGQDDDDKWMVKKKPYRTSLKVFFFTPELDKIVAKININILNMRSLDQVSFHRELDVQSCFKNPKAEEEAKLIYKAQKRDNYQSTDVDFTLNYPVVSRFALSRISRDYYARSSLFSQFLSSLHDVAGQELDPLQLADFQMKFDQDLIQLSGKLLNKPKVLSFKEQPGLRFSNLNTKVVVLSELKQNTEACAESCFFFDCIRFSYCRNSGSCKLQVNSSESLTDDEQTLELDSDCSTFRPRERRLNFEPLQMAHRLHHIISAQCQDTEPTSCPLSLKAEYRGVNGTENSLDLMPSFLDTEGILVDKSDKLGDEVAEDAEQSELSDIVFTKPQYIIMRENSKYKVPDMPSNLFPIQLAEHMTYPDCESLCDETDCVSFSHCQIEETCLISQVHDIGADSENLVEAESYCFIMARDQLSQFSKSINAKRPVGPTLPDSILAGPRECAARCISQPSSSCRSFYFCPTSGECILSSDSRHGDAEDNVERSNDNSTDSCEQYTRSLLQEFDKFYGKSILNNDKSEEELLGLGPETCALDCIDKNGDCPAFHVCQDANTKSLICTLARKQEDSNYTKLVKSLKNDTNCTSFLLRPSSVYRQLQSNDVDAEQVLENNEKEESSSSGHFFLYFFGVLVGFVAMIAVKYI